MANSGASCHMTGNRDWFKELRKCENPKIKIANNAKLSVEGKGDIDLKIHVNGSADQLKVKDTLYIPELSANLLSVSKITSKGYTVTFTKEKCVITDLNKELFATASLVNDTLVNDILS